MGRRCGRSVLSRTLVRNCVRFEGVVSAFSAVGGWRGYWSCWA